MLHRLELFVVHGSKGLLLPVGQRRRHRRLFVVVAVAVVVVVVVVVVVELPCVGVVPSIDGQCFPPAVPQ